MGPRTLSSTWRSFEKLARRYHDQPESREKTWADMRDLASRVNTSRIPDALAALLVHPYPGLEEAVVRFVDSPEDAPPDWVSDFEPEEEIVLISPIGVVAFERQCAAAVDALKTPETRRDFQTYRFSAYLAELRKLPTSQLLFLLILREVARARHITRVEKKGGGTEEVEDEAYMRLLWAFKELESFMRQMKGVSMRAEYGILWYESEWIVGKK